MLPVYKAISVDQEAISRGSTKPCIMMVADSNGKIVGDYVVKVFKPTNFEQSQPTNKEVYGNSLARAFDLAVSVVFPAFHAVAASPPCLRRRCHCFLPTRPHPQEIPPSAME
ncbi:MAG: hypothetical protein IPN76_27950 [Saprospiraceae bacterium]|nr:hypothetical protein [Saprospiraceae bacterium]